MKHTALLVLALSVWILGSAFSTATRTNTYKLPPFINKKAFNIQGRRVNTPLTITPNLEKSGVLDTSFSSDGMVIDQTMFANFPGHVSLSWLDNTIMLPVGNSVRLYTPSGLPAYMTYRVPTPLPDHRWPVLQDVAVQHDGKIVAIGGAQENDLKNPRYLLVRFNSNGALDKTFGTDGVVEGTMKGLPAMGWRVFVRADGRILMGGNYIDGNSGFCALALFDEKGSPDTSFGEDKSGVVQIPGSIPCSFDMNREGRILAAASSFSTASNGMSDGIYVWQYQPDGTLDATFPNLLHEIKDVLYMTSVASMASGGLFVESARYAPTGDILVGGFFGTSTSETHGFVTSLDKENHIRWTFPVPAIEGIKGNLVADIVPLANGDSILGIGGSMSASTPSFSLIKLTSSGRIDTTFGQNGWAKPDFPGGIQGQISSLVLEKGLPERIIAAGWATNNDVLMAGYFP